MPDDPAARSPWLRQLPPVVAAEVRRRRGAILASARGRVLDLDDPVHHHLVDGPLAVPVGGRAEHGAGAEGDDGTRYDTVVSTARLVAAPDLFWTLAALVARLDHGGELHLVEPVGRAGVLGLLTGSLGTALPGVSGLHLARDVPATVRAAGLLVVDCERFTVPTAWWPLRHFVQLRATHVPVSVARRTPNRRWWARERPTRAGRWGRVERGLQLRPVAARADRCHRGRRRAHRLGLREPGSPGRQRPAVVRRARGVGARGARADPARRPGGRARGGPAGQPAHLPGGDVGHAPSLGAQGHARSSTPSWPRGRAAPSSWARTREPTCCATPWWIRAAAPSPSGSGW